MNRLKKSSSSPERKRQRVSSESSLTNDERLIYNLIRSKTDIGISAADIKKETNLPTTVINKILKGLVSKEVVKDVPTIHNKGRKNYMATEFVPSTEITGGHFYSDGGLDTEFIDTLKKVCVQCISMQKVSTCDGCLEWCRRSGVFTIEINEKQIKEILETLILDDEIMQMTSTGYGDFASVPVGKTCYICKRKGGVKGEKKSVNNTNFPCFSCQRMTLCSPNGAISPETCVYFQKWLDF
jgi:DNA-directed RNA polymerase III subunit RPC6